MLRINRRNRIIATVENFFRREEENECHGEHKVKSGPVEDR